MGSWQEEVEFLNGLISLVPCFGQVAWEGTTQYTLRKAAAGFFRSMVSGEGIVAEFTGPGELLITPIN